jgi:hypothetical protein
VGALNLVPESSLQHFGDQARFEFWWLQTEAYVREEREQIFVLRRFFRLLGQRFDSAEVEPV